VALWVLLGLSPIAAGWFGVKLVLVVVYIVLGIASFRMRRQGVAVLTYLLALSVFVAIAWLALYRPL
jgi:uncharacterized membrane protein SirB2